MEAFLSRYTRLKRINFEDDKSVSLADIQKRHALAWGMMGMGMLAIHQNWQLIVRGEPNWFYIIVSLLIPLFHGFARASSVFAAKCFFTLGIFSFSERVEEERN